MSTDLPNTALECLRHGHLLRHELLLCTGRESIVHLYQLKAYRTYHGVFLERAGELASETAGAQVRRLVRLLDTITTPSRRARGAYHLPSDASPRSINHRTYGNFALMCPDLDAPKSWEAASVPGPRRETVWTDDAAHLHHSDLPWKLRVRVRRQSPANHLLTPPVRLRRSSVRLFWCCSSLLEGA